VPRTPPPQKRINRKDAAAYIREKFGVQLSPRTLEEAPIPYQLLFGQAMYTTRDLDAYVERQIEKAPRRMAARAKVADRAPARENA
jgi:hypothetical protein